MRTVTYGAACSLDGFITGPDGSLDWLHFSPDVSKEIASYWKTIDTILFGRKTWVAGEAQGGVGSGGSGKSKIRSYVFSRTLRSAPPGAELVRDDAGAFVRALKKKKGRGICVMGGGILAESLFEAGVIDEVGLNIHPVLLGSGVPMFRDAGRVRLELYENRTIDGGCVLAKYRVIR
jgi:dihydrofolate reductase